MEGRHSKLPKVTRLLGSFKVSLPNHTPPSVDPSWPSSALAGAQLPFSHNPKNDQPPLLLIGPHAAVSRAQFNETYTSLLAAYVASGSTGTGTGTGTSTPVPGATQSKHHLTSLMANGDADALPHSGNAKDLQDARAALYKLISKE